MLKLAIAGSGMIVKEFLPHFKATGWEVCAICGTKRSEEVVKELCRIYGGKPYCDYEKMLAEIDCDAVYIGVPNHLHYDFTKKALLVGKNVILEKPMTVNDAETKELYAIAKDKDVFLLEAITTLYLPVYEKVREWLSLIGKVRIVSSNYSQYSSRYDRFKQGIIEPVFDVSKAGGALGDLNIYNIHFIAGLFSGRKPEVNYLANVVKGVDTSGILTMDYGDFKAVAIGAKDCAAPVSTTVQGDLGYIKLIGPPNVCKEAELCLNNGTKEFFNEGPAHRMISEFTAFHEMIKDNDKERYEAMTLHSISVMEILSKARVSAGMVYSLNDL